MDSISLGSQVVQYLFAGLTVGAIFALVALGFNIIYNVTEVINFAQGEFVVLGRVGPGRAGGIPGDTALFKLFYIRGGGSAGGHGHLLGRHSSVAPTHDPDHDHGHHCHIHHTEGLGHVHLGKGPLCDSAFYGCSAGYALGGLHPGSDLLDLGHIRCPGGGADPVFQRTLTGKAMRACADNPGAASLVGISPGRMILFAFALSAALGAVGGAIITPITLMEYDRGAMLALKGFGAAILGGLGNFYGAVAAGFLLGLLESFATGFISSSYKDAIALIVLLIVLFARPQGLMGSSLQGDE